MRVNYNEELSKEEFEKVKDAAFVFIPSFNFKTGTIREDGTLVGIFNLSYNFDFINLDGLEILEEFRGRNYGSKFIKQLFIDHPNCKSIQGFAADTSKGFYEKLKDMNITFLESCSFCNVSNCPRLEDQDVYCEFYSNNHFNIEQL